MSDDGHTGPDTSPPPPENEGTADSQQPTASLDAGAVAGERIGDYRLLQEIGVGGMGQVFEAEQERPICRRVALKIIKLGLDTRQVIARFEAERQALAMMDHPNIARVLDAGATETGRPFFVMELVRGLPITEYCDTHRLSTRERLELFGQVCSGVQHAHDRAIIHRDLKPSNVLVAELDGQRVPKIIDFGIAKATARPLTEKTLFTQLGALIGTPEYMSPEQANLTGQNVDTRTDVYSLGVMLYELIVGALPLDPKELRAAGFEGIRRKILEEQPHRPSTKLSTLGNTGSDSAYKRRADLPTLRRQLLGDLDWISMKALEKDRARRYGSPRDLAADIGRHLDHRPVEARPPSVTYRATRFMKRHRPALAVTAIVLVALVALLSSIWYGKIDARRERLARAESALATIINSGRIPESLEADWPALHELVLVETRRNPTGKLALTARRAAAGFDFRPTASFALTSDPPDVRYSPRPLFDPGVPLRYRVVVEGAWDTGSWTPFVSIGSASARGAGIECSSGLADLVDPSLLGPGPHALQLRAVYAFPDPSVDTSGDDWRTYCAPWTEPVEHQTAITSEVRALETLSLNMFDEYPDDFPRALPIADSSLYPIQLEKLTLFALEIEPSPLPCMRIDFPAPGPGYQVIPAASGSADDPAFGAAQLIGDLDRESSLPVAGRATLRLEGYEPIVAEFEIVVGEGNLKVSGGGGWQRDRDSGRYVMNFPLEHPTRLRRVFNDGHYEGRLQIVGSRDVARETRNLAQYLGDERTLSVPVEIRTIRATPAGEDQCGALGLGPG